MISVLSDTRRPITAFHCHSRLLPFGPVSYPPKPFYASFVRGFQRKPAWLQCKFFCCYHPSLLPYFSLFSNLCNNLQAPTSLPHAEPQPCSDPLKPLQILGSRSAHSVAYSFNFSSTHRTMTHLVSPMIEVLLPFKYRFLLLC